MSHLVKRRVSTLQRFGWLEVAGAGMVHPEVLKAGGLDPEEFILVLVGVEELNGCICYYMESVT